jgi:hypothetical protein
MEVVEGKDNKAIRYYYRHREEILAKKHQARMEDPEYRDKYEAREASKAAKEEARAAKEATRKEKLEESMRKARDREERQARKARELEEEQERKEERRRVRARELGVENPSGKDRNEESAIRV